MQILKIIISLIISLIPHNFLKVKLLNFFLSYKIDTKSKIGFFNIICINKVFLQNGEIGNFNYINIQEMNLLDTKISNFNRIYNFNIFETKNFSLVGSFNIIFGKNKQIGVLKMNKAQFTTSHIIEVNNEFFLDEDVVFGGINSIINSGKTLKKTEISKNVYFGSSIFLAAGSSICEKVLVGSGSTIHKDIIASGLYTSNTLKKSIL